MYDSSKSLKKFHLPKFCIKNRILLSMLKSKRAKITIHINKCEFLYDLGDAVFPVFQKYNKRVINSYHSSILLLHLIINK